MRSSLGAGKALREVPVLHLPGVIERVPRRSADGIEHGPSLAAAWAHLVLDNGRVMRELAQKNDVDLFTAPAVTARSGENAKIELSSAEMPAM